jgi:ATP synthase protein I
MRPLADTRPTDDLDARIASAKAAGSARGPVATPPAKGYAQGSRVLAELIGMPIGGGVLGWALDSWFHTSPWCLLAFVALAFVAAFRNIMKISKERAE